MVTRRRKTNSKNLLIFVLLIIVIVETYLLFQQPPPTKKPFIKKPKKEVVEKIEKKEIEKPIAGQIAIIIDDWGYNIQDCEYLQKIPSPLSVSILPKLPHSADIATCAHAHHKEVMLHLPLEPHEVFENYPTDYLITTKMNKEKINEILNENLDSIPFVRGVNNHTGSKATENRRVMSIIFTTLKKRGLFFVDSLVTPDSVCREVAQKFKIPFATRDVFLDNENNRAYIENQFAELAQEAKRKGFAIAIGHDRPLTLQIIKEQTGLLENQGFKFVTVKELIKSR